MPQTQFRDHIIVAQNPEDYIEVQTSPACIFKGWELSPFAYELLNRDGSIKTESDLAGDTLQKFIAASEAIKRGEPLEKPILGIGLNDDIEIGVGREIIAAAYHAGLTSIPTKIPKGQADCVQQFLNTL